MLLNFTQIIDLHYSVTLVSKYCTSYLCLAFSDDLLEDSDSEEHSRSESVTGTYMVFLVNSVEYEIDNNVLRTLKARKS